MSFKFHFAKQDADELNNKLSIDYTNTSVKLNLLPDSIDNKGFFAIQIPLNCWENPTDCDLKIIAEAIITNDENQPQEDEDEDLVKIRKSNAVSIIKKQTAINNLKSSFEYKNAWAILTSVLIFFQLKARMLDLDKFISNGLSENYAMLILDHHREFLLNLHLASNTKKLVTINKVIDFLSNNGTGTNRRCIQPRKIHEAISPKTEDTFKSLLSVLDSNKYPYLDSITTDEIYNVLTIALNGLVSPVDIDDAPKARPLKRPPKHQATQPIENNTNDAQHDQVESRELKSSRFIDEVDRFEASQRQEESKRLDCVTEALNEDLEELFGIEALDIEMDIIDDSPLDAPYQFLVNADESDEEHEQNENMLTKIDELYETDKQIDNATGIHNCINNELVPSEPQADKDFVTNENGDDDKSENENTIIFDNSIFDVLS